MAKRNKFYPVKKAAFDLYQRAAYVRTSILVAYDDARNEFNWMKTTAELDAHYNGGSLLRAWAVTLYWKVRSLAGLVPDMEEVECHNK